MLFTEPPHELLHESRLAHSRSAANHVNRAASEGRIVDVLQPRIDARRISPERGQGTGILNLDRFDRRAVKVEPAQHLVDIDRARAEYFGQPALHRAALATALHRAVLVTGRWQDSFAQPASRRQILIRMLENLRGLAASEGNTDALNQYLEALLVLEPDSASFRGMRAVTRFQLGQKAAAIEDLTWVIEHPPRGLNLTPVLEMKRRFKDELDRERQAAEERTR